MTINGLWNKRCGPGGGTRRLHHRKYGDEIGSTRVVKINSSFGEHRRYRAKTINANGNTPAFANSNSPRVAVAA